MVAVCGEELKAHVFVRVPDRRYGLVQSVAFIPLGRIDDVVPFPRCFAQDLYDTVDTGIDQLPCRVVGESTVNFVALVDDNLWRIVSNSCILVLLRVAHLF